MLHRFTAIAVATSSAILFVVLGSVSTAQAHDDASKPEYYTTKVKPILDANCARCHGGENHRGGLNMDTRESLLKGGHDGAVVVPGDPANSLLVKLIRHEGPADDPMDMPPKKPKLSDADIQVVTDWIKAGAVMPQ
jgi:mono/diheme cytochrome c family protein